MIAALVCAGLGFALFQSPSVARVPVQVPAPAARAGAPQPTALASNPSAPMSPAMSSCGPSATSPQRPEARSTRAPGDPVSACPTGPDVYLKLLAMHTPPSAIDQMLLSNLPAPAGTTGYQLLRRLGAPPALAQRLADRWESEHSPNTVTLDGT